MAQVIIENAKTDERYGIDSAIFKTKHVRDGKTYEALGFKIVSRMDGSPYEPSKPAASAPKAAAPKAAPKPAPAAPAAPVAASGSPERAPE